MARAAGLGVRAFFGAGMSMQKWPCVSLIGMPAAGKTTIGKLLADKLQWGILDTDAVMESLYAAPLQNVTDALGKAEFLAAESNMICVMQLGRCVIATGGSVVYSEKAMRHLAKLGLIVFVNAPLDIIVARVAEKPDRGIAIGPNQTLAELFAERETLYKKYAQIICDSGRYDPEQCADWLAHKVQNWLAQDYPIKGEKCEAPGA